MSRLLLCTDLDRTLIPNGPQAESVEARKKFSQLVNHQEVTLVYVTGRDKKLVEQAIKEYQLPQPGYVIADVGSTIYEIENSHWRYLMPWEKTINQDWQGKGISELHALFPWVKELTLQEEGKQNTHKLSYYVPLDCDIEKLMQMMKHILKQHLINANLIWSVDLQANIGLLDVLPASAGKRQAIEFLMALLHFNYADTVFSGDSGNDICVMSSPIKSVLVANAEEDVREAAIKQAKESQQLDTLYIAQGNFMGMNGNYSAGILEGVAHYIPQIEHWLRDEI